MILALLNQKGGVGKTTLATHIAGELALRGLHVILLDADPQGSSLDWTQRRSQQGLPRLFSAVGLARETLHQEAPELARRADHIIITSSDLVDTAQALADYRESQGLAAMVVSVEDVYDELMAEHRKAGA